MASNLVQSYPPAPGAATPPTELAPFGNNSSSAQVNNFNYVAGSPAPVNGMSANVGLRNQVIKGQQEYPR